MIDRLAFILYDSRSGSTLLASLLNRFEGMMVTLESAYVSRILELGDSSLLLDVDFLIQYLYEEVQFIELGIDKDDLRGAFKSAPEGLTKRSIIEIITRSYFNDESFSSKYIVIKHPPFNYMPDLIEMFPSVKFIQIVRDGRGVFNSKKRTYSLDGTRMETNIIMAALDWRWKVIKSRKYPNHVISIRYEDLIKNTELTLHDLVQYLSLNQDEMRTANERNEYFESIGEKQKSLHKNVKRHPRIENIYKWKTELTIEEIKLYSYINRKMLREFNYQVERVKLPDIFFFYLFSVGDLVITKFFNSIKLLAKPKEFVVRLKRRVLLLR